MLVSRTILGLAALFALPSGTPGARPAPRGDPDLRLEHFVLELREAGSASNGRAVREVGLVCLRRRAIEGGTQLECECLFRRDGPQSQDGGGDEHVLHVEQLSSAGTRLDWREWGPGRARSFTAEWTADGRALRTVESCRGGTPRETLSASEGAVMPLYLLDLARYGRATSGRYKRLDPLARNLEAVELCTSYKGEAGPGRRTVEIVRDDGTLAGRFEFHGTDLETFQWQEGDLVARRVSVEEYAARSAPPVSAVRPP
jgi:hypothetical protein